MTKILERGILSLLPHTWQKRLLIYCIQHNTYARRANFWGPFEIDWTSEGAGACQASGNITDLVMAWLSLGKWQLLAYSSTEKP